MSKYDNRIILLLTMLLLQACQSRPDRLPDPAPVVESAPLVETAPAPLVEPEPIDFNQQTYDRAIAALKAGDVDVAIELLLEVSVDAPRKPFLYTNLGLAYFKLENFELASQAFEQAIRINDQDAVALNHLGIIQRQNGRFDEARRQYQRAIEIDENYAPAHLNLGILFDLYLQDLDKALRQYEIYQALILQQDPQVAGWIVDIKRRLKPAKTQSQGQA